LLDLGRSDNEIIHTNQEDQVAEGSPAVAIAEVRESAGREFCFVDIGQTTQSRRIAKGMF